MWLVRDANDHAIRALLRWFGVATLVALFCRPPARWPACWYWRANDMYSYASRAVISGYIIWLRREVVRNTPAGAAPYIGGIVLAGAVCILLLGNISSTNLLVWLSLPITVTGLCLLVIGTRRTRTIAFPLVYLFAMIPFWSLFTTPLQAPFQLYSAVLGVEALRIFELPVARDGVLIHLPTITLEVADVCSGVNQLVALMCIGVPVAHLHVRRWPKRLLILLLVVVIALISNGARVAAISLYAIQTASRPGTDVHGPYSFLRMTLISGIGFVVLFWLIARFSDRIAPDTSPSQADGRAVAGGTTGRRSAVIIGVAILAGALAFDHWHATVPVRPQASLALLPSTLAGWRAVVETAGAAGQAAGFDQAVSRRYVAADGAELELLVGYFDRQEQDHELVGYEVSRLLSMDTQPVAVDLNGRVRVRDCVIGEWPTPACNLLQSNGRVVSGDTSEMVDDPNSLTRKQQRRRRHCQGQGAVNLRSDTCRSAIFLRRLSRLQSLLRILTIIVAARAGECENDHESVTRVEGWSGLAPIAGCNR